MEEVINTLIVEHFGAALFVMLAIVVFLFGAIWKISAFWHDFKSLPCEKNSNAIEDLEAKVAKKDDLPCSRNQEKIIEHERSISRAETSISYLTRNIEDLTQEIRKRNNGLILTQTNSPLSITEEGKAVLVRLGMYQMFEDNWDRIKELITAGVGSKNAYDIDRFCLEQAVVFPEKFLTEAQLLVIKDDAYKQGLTLTAYMRMIAVLSRDRYLAEESIAVNDNP